VAFIILRVAIVWKLVDEKRMNFMRSFILNDLVNFSLRRAPAQRRYSYEVSFDLSGNRRSQAVSGVH